MKELKQILKKPKCVAMIMDGNRRWAKERNLHSLKGHQAGFNKIKEVVDWSIKEEIPNVILYTFSIENWKRSKEEVSYLMNIIKLLIKKEFYILKNKGVRISFIGDLSLVPKDIKKLIEKTEKEKIKFQKLHLVLAFSYGGRREILNTVKEIVKVKNKKEIENFTEEDFSKFLWTNKIDVPDPDLIIRTGGEMRLSNFLPWQATYSELFFLKTYWPDFNYKKFKEILEEFSLRERRLGK